MLTNNEQKIREIQEKKRKLKDRIEKLNSETSSQLYNSGANKSRLVLPTYQQKMTSLLQKKKKIEEQKEQQYKFKKMQDQYIQRRKQAEREKRLQQIRNQKRMIQLEAGMKRIVFEGVKQKVKGTNSEQLMIRAMLRDEHEGEKPRTYTSKGNVRRDFEKFLQTQEQRNIKQKWDIYQLNEKRFEIFEKKEEAYMREILLKQLIAQGKQEVDVLELTRPQLEDKLQEFGLNLEDYLQNISKEEMVEAVPEMEKLSAIRIEQYRREKEKEDEAAKQYERLKRRLKEDLLRMEPEQVKMMRSLVLSIIDECVFNYQKRINRFTVQQIPMAKEQLEQRYKNVRLQSETYEYSKIITLKLLERIHEQFFIEAAEQMAKLNNFAHDKTEQCFAWMFKEGTDISKKFRDITDLNIPLEFESDTTGIQQPVQKPSKKQLHKQNYLNNFEDYTNNIFDVDKLTTQLINQINLLQAENDYFKDITIKIYNERPAPQTDFHILYDRQLYLVTHESVFNSRKTKKLQPIGIKDSLEILHWEKFHNFWIIHDSEKVSLYSAWGLEVLKNDIGQRMGTTSGKITSLTIYPIYSFIGGICSLILGFQKGAVMKYNFNLDRVDNSQTNLSIYRPLLPQVKTGDQPPFPLNKKKTIPIENRKITGNAEIHEFRQFFDHHTAPIIGIVFYKFNSFITVDKSMKCAIWYYDQKQGSKCYKPGYTFEFVSSYYVYKEAEDSRYKQIFPGSNNRQSSEQLYDKWMQTEGFLKKQIYNNPKNKVAYYRVSDVTEQKGDVALWKVNYVHESKKVLKIYQSYYTPIEGKMEGLSTKLWRQYLLVLCQREHPIRKDLRTIKVYGWDIYEKKMRSVGIQFDIYEKQKKLNFEILDNMLAGVDMHLMAVVSSGRILIFSLLSGQLLRNISDPQFLQNPSYQNAFFTEITVKKALLAAATKSFTAQISFNDHNDQNQQKQMNQIIDEARKKYINLL